MCFIQSAESYGSNLFLIISGYLYGIPEHLIHSIGMFRIARIGRAYIRAFFRAIILYGYNAIT